MVSRLTLLVLVSLSAARAGRLPDGPVIMGYGNWNQCNGQIIDVARDGVNVMMWSFASLHVVNGTAAISSGPDVGCVARVAANLTAQGLTTTHMISVGGWNSAHPNTSFNGSVWFDVFHSWNTQVVANASLGFAGFDGIDWDLEGNDSPTSPTNNMTLECLDLVGTMSVAAKRAGYLVSLAPCQSYLDVTTPAFDLSLQHNDPSYHPKFFYHGHNAYAYLLAKYDFPPTSTTATFDLVGLQVHKAHPAHAFALCPLFGSHSHHWPAPASACVTTHRPFALRSCTSRGARRTPASTARTSPRPRTSSSWCRCVALCAFMLALAFDAPPPPCSALNFRRPWLPGGWSTSPAPLPST